ncbi:hypothetical protein FACS18945_3420 [Bacteroidia bacterium]|nr:hypothetical protein FACS18945_3420 [Bacteroidia bacterium]
MKTRWRRKLNTTIAYIFEGLNFLPTFKFPFAGREFHYSEPQLPTNKIVDKAVNDYSKNPR